MDTMILLNSNVSSALNKLHSGMAPNVQHVLSLHQFGQENIANIVLKELIGT